MASFQEHINQAKKNLIFLECINFNNPVPDSADWQVTTVFYIGVHLINAHLAASCNLHYASHSKVKAAINPNSQTSLARLPDDDVYVAFVKLQNLSRRSRYLCKDADIPLEEDKGYLTHDKHFVRALRHLEVLMNFIHSKYKIEFTKHTIQSLDLSNSKDKLKYFDVVAQKSEASFSDSTK